MENSPIPATPDTEDRDHIARVRSFYDRESSRYVEQRYGTSEPRVARPYLERLQIILEMFDRSGGDVLDLGCGPGVLIPHLLDRGCRVTALDLSPAMVAKAAAGTVPHPRAAAASFCVGEAGALPFPERAFDAVTCIGVISYWPDVSRGLAEVARVLRPGGTLIVQASHPLSPWEVANVSVRAPLLAVATALTGRELRDADFPLRRYLPGGLERRLRANGLDPIARRHYDFRMPFLHRVSVRLADRVAVSLLRLAGDSPFGFLGSGYVVRAIRGRGPGGVA